MTILNQIIALAKKTVSSLARNESPTDLEKSKLFSKKEKEGFFDRLTDESKISERSKVVGKIDREKDWKILQRKIQSPTRTLPPWIYTLAVVASVVFIISISYILVDKDIQGNNPVIVNTNIKMGTDKATLTLEDGSDITLEKGQSYEAKNLTSNGEELVYLPAARLPAGQGQTGNTTTTKKAEIAYNYLTIPRGGQFHVKLSDGTEVWLNSDSKLKYPVSFVEGETRQVELVYGEAYFDVSPSTDHKGANFKVLSKFQEVEVLGTEFSIKAYKDEFKTFTTLVEGKVAVSNAITKQNISPNQQSILNHENKNITITMVDVYNETSWKKGLFSFKDKPLFEIMKVLSRWYDIDAVDFEKKELEIVKFDGVLSKNQNIEDILTIIKDIGSINGYKITDKHITIN